MLQYKTLLAESKTPLLLAQKEIASLQKELDGFRKAVDAKAKERDAMEREAKFAKAETEKVAVSVLSGLSTAPSRHRRAWSPGEQAVGGLLVDSGAVRTSREPRDRGTPQNASKSTERPPTSS